MFIKVKTVLSYSVYILELFKTLNEGKVQNQVFDKKAVEERTASLVKKLTVHAFFYKNGVNPFHHGYS